MSHDTTTTAGKAAVMLAEDKGAQIECMERKYPEEGWYAATAPCWDWHLFDYRVKPEPLTVWMNIYSDGYIGGPHKSRAVAEATKGPGFIRCAKFVEVIE